MALDSMQEILDRAAESGKPFWEIVLDTDMESREVTRDDSVEKMRFTWRSMVASSDAYTGERRSVSGLVGGDGAKMRAFIQSGRMIGGNLLGEIIAEALAMGESNACMRKIVAAPTAGACGVLPAVLIPMYRWEIATETKILQSLYVASGIGAVIAYRACISGASGGCQAEIGSASAMAAGALVHLRDGTADQIANAVAMALKNLMGLICDPVAGLVEVPCVKRNVIGAMNAVSAADMALAGIESRVPVDEVIDAMGDVGRHMPIEFRETALGGLAATPFGCAVRDQLAEKRNAATARLEW
ncbi:MAG: L-serine ammonia-lyase, iron-sulfur-dependent, subunit alpha [Oscillospiraceae bacterium]